MDMFSFLPDHLLVIILSFLAFQEAGRTSVLSRRWQNIWRQTRNIEFNERFFSYIGADDEARRIAFVNFVQNWTDNYQPSVLDRVCITFSRPGNFLVLVEDCIRFAVTRGVKVLGLDFSDPSWNDELLELGNYPEPAYVLPQFVYQHGVLESLTLSSCNFNLPEIINFHLLKHLALGWIELPLPTLSVLLNKFPLLESLSVKNCWNTDGLQVGGQNLRLRSLVVEKFIMSENPWIEIEAPHLRYLKYSGTMAVFDIEAGELEEAYLDFGLEYEGNEGMGDLLYQLLHQLPVRTLTVCTYMLQVLPLELISNGVTPVFGVAKLTLRTAMLSCEQKGVKYLLRSCPVLQALTIQIVPQRLVDLDEGQPDDVRHVWTLNALEYHCINQTLRVVQVKGYTGTRHEIGFLKYLFCRGRVLEKLHISIGEELLNQRSIAENRQLVIQTFQGLRRASNNLRINTYGR
ncbi:putative F-box/LRR-repeat protein At1g56400 [Rosa rugosa]|uniref:putative F-box/LRR-repeat protein At1g56400 n=1 Tax=Rosa rugosa TaxID=74645 RepID=UPI002B40C470|nr:putative F-box/LRR-repeat protein At1g56400 [Rosa rugosa]